MLHQAMQSSNATHQCNHTAKPHLDPYLGAELRIISNMSSFFSCGRVKVAVCAVMRNKIGVHFTCMRESLECDMTLDEYT